MSICAQKSFLFLVISTLHAAAATENTQKEEEEEEALNRIAYVYTSWPLPKSIPVLPACRVATCICTLIPSYILPEIDFYLVVYNCTVDGWWRVIFVDLHRTRRDFDERRHRKPCGNFESADSTCLLLLLLLPVLAEKVPQHSKFSNSSNESSKRAKIFYRSHAGNRRILTEFWERRKPPDKISLASS